MSEWEENRRRQNIQWEINRQMAAMIDALQMGQKLDPVPDWQTRKIDAACDYWELQMMGILG